MPPLLRGPLQRETEKGEEKAHLSASSYPGIKAETLWTGGGGGSDLHCHQGELPQHVHLRALLLLLLQFTLWLSLLLLLFCVAAKLLRLLLLLPLWSVLSTLDFCFKQRLFVVVVVGTSGPEKVKQITKIESKTDAERERENFLCSSPSSQTRVRNPHFSLTHRVCRRHGKISRSLPLIICQGKNIIVFPFVLPLIADNIPSPIRNRHFWRPPGALRIICLLLPPHERDRSHDCFILISP